MKYRVTFDLTHTHTAPHLGQQNPTAACVFTKPTTRKCVAVACTCVFGDSTSGKHMATSAAMMQFCAAKQNIQKRPSLFSRNINSRIGTRHFVNPHNSFILKPTCLAEQLQISFVYASLFFSIALTGVVCLVNQSDRINLRYSAATLIREHEHGIPSIPITVSY